MATQIKNKTGQRLTLSFANEDGSLESFNLMPREVIPNDRRPQEIDRSKITQYTKGLERRKYIRIREVA